MPLSRINAPSGLPLPSRANGTTTSLASPCPHPPADTLIVNDSLRESMAWCRRCGSLCRPSGPRDPEAPTWDWEAPLWQRSSPEPPPAPPLSPAIDALIAANQGIFLDVGCSDHKSAGSIGMDVRAVEGVDIVWDICQTPWPLPEACVKRLLMSHILEHIPPDKIMGIMSEAHRVLQPNAQALIAMPYGVSPRALQDPTHFRCWIESVPQYWDCEYPLFGVYAPPCFKIELCEWNSIGDISIIMAKRSGTHGQYCIRNKESA